MKICILGASGSIGTQTIDVMLKNPTDFDLVGFSVGNNTRKISNIVKHFSNVKCICIKDSKKLSYYSKKYANIRFFAGNDGLLDLISHCNCDMVVNALVGFVGLKPTLFSLEQNKIVCLANKESLVVGGELINDMLNKGMGKLIPIDSEHVALSKCLAVQSDNVKKLIITASGGAFRKLNRDELTDVTPEMALNHPTWKMGKKITIDCATMVNKTFEVIEAHYLFGYSSDKIGIVINYNSYVHSIVEYNDHTYRMEVGKPDMRKPIKYAIYQGLCPFDTAVSNSLENLPNIEFKQFDIKRYPIIKYADTVIENKGTYGAVLNASNEVAVNAFLNHEIAFLDIERIISHFMDNHINIVNPDYETLEKVDRETREATRQYIRKEIGQCKY